jgi:hypothetical protein
MPCIFCSKEPVTREHIYPRAWIEWLAPNAESFTNTRATGEGRAEPVNTWNSRDLDVVVRCVCADCNSGWMNRLDEQAQDAVRHMAQGENRVQVVDGGLTQFATWATKMVLVMECLFDRFIVPQEVRDHLFRHQEPHPSVRIWVATMETWDGEVRTTPMSLKSGSEVGGLEQAYLVTFRLLHLVIQVVVPLHEGVMPEHDEWGELHSDALWHRDEMLVWPLPRDRMLSNDADYYRLTESFRSGDIRVA